MAKKFWNTDKLLSTTAIFISLLTLIVFLYQTNLIRKQQYMSVLPYLELGNFGAGTDNYRFILENNGIGPAIITHVEVKNKEGRKYRDIIDYVQDHLTEEDSVNFYYSNIVPGRLLPEKERVEIITINDGKESSSDRIYEILHREDLLIEIGFESVYGEQWIVDNRNRYPIKR